MIDVSANDVTLRLEQNEEGDRCAYELVGDPPRKVLGAGNVSGRYAMNEAARDAYLLERIIESYIAPGDQQTTATPTHAPTR